MTSPERWLAIELEKLKNGQQAKGSSPQLGHSAIHDGKIDEFRGETLVQRIGKQVDGTNTTSQFNGPTPPAPSVPTVQPRVGGAVVRWDGTWAGGAVAPMDLARIDVHILSAPDEDPMLSRPAGSIVAQGWGEASINLSDGAYWAVLVARTTSGMFAISGVSDPVAVSTTIGPTEPPEDVPVPTAEAAAVGGVQATWPAVDGATWYEVAASLEPGVPEDGSAPTTIRTPLTRGQIFAVGGAPLTTTAAVYMKVRAGNDLGATAWSAEISAAPRTADAVITAAFIASMEIQAQQIVAGVIESDLGLLAKLMVGGFVEIDGITSSITIYADVDHTQPLVQLRPEGSVFRGRVIADDISVLNGLILIGTTSQLASGAVMTLMSGVADPATPPTVSFNTIGSTWPTVPSGFTERGISWDAIDGCWIRLLVSTAVDIAGLCRVQRISTAGAVLGYVTLGNVTGIGEDDLNSITRSGAFYYSVITHSTDARRRVGRWEAVNGAYSAMSNPTLPSIWIGRTAVGKSVDGNLVHAGVMEQGGVRGIAWEIIDPDDMSMGFSHPYYDGSWDPTWSTNIMYASMDSYSFPAARIVVVAGSTARAFDYTDVTTGTAPAYDDDFAFDLGGSVATGGAARNASGVWYSVVSNQQLQRYSEWLPETGEGNVYAVYANNDGTYHTAHSPMGESLALHRRRFATVTVDSMPDGVTGATVYALASPTTPATTALLGRPETMVNGSVTFDPSVAGSGAPPTSSTFPGGVPSEFKSANEKFIVRGDGSGDWRQLTRYTGNVCEKTANQAITSRTPTTAWTDVTWIDPSTDRGRGLITWDTATDSYVNAGDEPIIVGVRARVAFAGNATGARWMSIKRVTSGAVTSYVRSDTKQTGNTGVVVLEVDIRTTMAVGDKLSVVAAQNSGADLDIIGTLTSSAGPANEFEIEFKGFADA